MKNLVFYGTFEDLALTYHDLKPEDLNWKNRDFLRIDNNICSNPFERMIIFKTDNQIYFLIDEPDWNQEDTYKIENVVKDVITHLAEDFNCSPFDFEIEITIMDYQST